MKRNPSTYTKFQFDPTKILYLIGDSNYSHLHLVSGQTVLTCKTLKWYANRWPSFLRLHKRVLINVDYVHEYLPADTRKKNAYVVMNDLARLAVARRRTEEVLSRLQLETLV